MKQKLIIPAIFLIMIASVTLFAQSSSATIVINADLCKDTISRHIYGHFSEHLGHCIYGGIWVGENSDIPNTRGIRNDIVAALKKINIPNLRWPGGCFADEYHWMDGIGPKEKRAKMINTHWGGVVEDNSFGTHEFLDLCEQLGTEPYITGNVGSGTVEEMSKWVEYITFKGTSPMANLRKQNGREKPWKVKFWGLGNECWGCGGNMTAEYYTDQFRKYATYCRNYGGNNLFKIACGPYADNPQWLETVMKNVPAEMMNGVSLHYYTLPKDWDAKGSATKFDETEYFSVVRKSLLMEDHVRKFCTIMDKYDLAKKIGLMVDEWGNWYDVEPGTNPGFLYQQSTLRDAITCAINLNIFNNHCDRVKMANIAQLINVLQSLILTDGPKMLLTPTYYVFEMYKVHQDAALIPVNIKTPDYEFNGTKIPAVNVSASKDKQGVIHISLVNANPHSDIEVSCDLRGTKNMSVTGKIITANNFTDHNTFDAPNVVRTEDFKNCSLNKNVLNVKLPAKSVVMLEVK